MPCYVLPPFTKAPQLMKENGKENLELKYSTEYRHMRYTEQKISHLREKIKEKNLGH